MTEQMTIQNFGPIRQATIDVRDLTVFVGPQAAGKSLAAQILYFMRGLESLALHPTRKRTRFARDESLTSAPDSPRRDILSGLEWWLGNDLSVYTTAQTTLSWNPRSSSKKTEYAIVWDREGPKLNEAMERRIRERESVLLRPEVYIPAGRALYSFLPPASALRLFSSPRSRLKWPGYIPVFYEALEDALDQLWQDQGRGRQTSLFEVAIDTRFLRRRIDSIFKGEIRYGPDTVSLEVGRKRLLRAETIAAGQMEIWPFWAILQVSLRAGPNIPRIYFEEPEAHLHPDAQRSVVEIIACVVRQRGQFVITTHSPYILYAINNSLMIQKVLKAGRHLPRGVPQEIGLRPEQVAAYRFSSDGTVHDIMDGDVGLIDEDELDRVADELGATFSRLQEQMGGGE